ncbi:MAG: CvpA family protein [Candidatus Aerophobetes bacterium]|nr:CvpA family protein [Candidatus Aerophobetes bacterium]
MNWLDVVLGVFIILFAIRGVVKGLFKEACGLIGIVVGLLVAINRYEGVGEIISSEFNFIPPKISYLISFVLIFVGIALIGGVAGIILHKASKYTIIRGIDGGGGFILGLIEGALICSIILILLDISPISKRANKWMKGSTLTSYLIKVGPFVYDNIVSLAPRETKKFMQKLEKFKGSIEEKGKGLLSK